MAWGFYKRRLRATMDWGNTYASNGFCHPCGCVTDHIFIESDKEKGRSRRIVVYPCMKHTGKFFRTKWN